MEENSECPICSESDSPVYLWHCGGCGEYKACKSCALKDHKRHMKEIEES